MFKKQCSNVEVHEPHEHTIHRTKAEAAGDPEALAVLPDEWDSTYKCPGHQESPLERMMLYKEILDNGGTLSLQQKQDLEAITEYVVAMVQAFITAVSEALAPAIEVMAKAAKQLWESLTPELQQYLIGKPQHGGAVLNDVATPYSEAQARAFVPPYDSEARQAQHYPGRGGW